MSPKTYNTSFIANHHKIVIDNDIAPGDRQ